MIIYIYIYVHALTYPRIQENTAILIGARVVNCMRVATYSMAEHEYYAVHINVYES